MRARGGEREHREERDWLRLEAEKLQLGKGRGDGEEELIVEGRDVVAVEGDREEGEVREL